MMMMMIQNNVDFFAQYTPPSITMKLYTF